MEAGTYTTGFSRQVDVLRPTFEAVANLRDQRRNASSIDGALQGPALSFTGLTATEKAPRKTGSVLASEPVRRDGSIE